MMKVFTGQWRGPGRNEKHAFMQLDFKFRDYLSNFKGASLGVFLALCLHSDQDGDSYPSYTKLEEETGYGRDTIAAALSYLCKLEIEDCRVLVRYREKDEAGKYVGSNKYKVFPTQEEVEEVEGSWILPPLENATSGKCLLEVEPVLKQEPVVKKSVAAQTSASGSQRFQGKQTASASKTSTSSGMNNQSRELAELMNFAARKGVDKRTYTAMTNALLEVVGGSSIAGTSSEYGDLTHKSAQQVVKNLIELDIKTPEKVLLLGDIYRLRHWAAKNDIEKGLVKPRPSKKHFMETVASVADGYWPWDTDITKTFTPEHFIFRDRKCVTINQEGDFVDPDDPCVILYRDGSLKSYIASPV